jgi:tetratricopeptide (TPR) repeat protein
LFAREGPVENDGMLFGGDKKAKFDKECAATREALGQSKLSEARHHAEAALALARELPDRSLLLMAAGQLVDALVLQGEWAQAQETWQETAASLLQNPGPSLQATLQTHACLVDLLRIRERYDEALGVIDAFGAGGGDKDELYVVTDAAEILVEAGRPDEALALAQRIARKEEQGNNANRKLHAARRLASVMVMTGHEVDRAIELAVSCGRARAVTDEVTLLFRLICLVPLAQGLIKRGDFNEAAAEIEAALAPLGRIRTPHPRPIEVSEIRLRCLQAEAFVGLGELDKAARLYQASVRRVETELKNPRDWELIRVLEGYARVLRKQGDERGADTQQRRAQAIRLQVTGHKEAPAHREDPISAGRAWPKRTLAGIFALRGVNKDITQVICEKAYAGYQGPPLGRLNVVRPDAEGEAFLFLEKLPDPWQPTVAVMSKLLLRSLTGVVETINTGIAFSAEGRRSGAGVEIAPWHAVSDVIQCEWWRWPEGERERLEREIFPRLPGWVGVIDSQPRWLGEGVRMIGETWQVAPWMRLEFQPNRGVLLSGAGPAETLDAWFLALARATKWFPQAAYERFAPLPITTPIARA